MSDAGLPGHFSFEEMALGNDDTGVIDQSFDFVDPSSVGGSDPLRFTPQRVKFRRQLYKLQGIDVQWVGVVIPAHLYLEPTPHIFFHPTTAQAGISDAHYAAFDRGWAVVYDAYSFWMGAQIAAVKKAQHALVIPFYNSAQAQDLGNFNRHLKAVVVKLLTDAVKQRDPLIIYDDEVKFQRICTSSFSIGIAAQKHFQSKGADVANMTDKLF